MPRILVVDDDPHLLKLVSATLTRAAFLTLEAQSGQAAWAILDDGPVDLVVLDIMLPDTDGWTLCRRIRETMDVPIVMLTALGDTSHKVHGLHLGADDYLPKPFEPDELVARIKAVLRRFRINAEHAVSIRDLRLDSMTRQVTLSGEAVIMPPKEFALLFHLASYPGQTLLREHLIESIWGYDFDGDERTLDVHIKRIRDRFADREAPFSIRTIRGLGYRLDVLSS